MTADLGNWQAYQPTRLDRLRDFYDANRPHPYWIAALVATVILALAAASCSVAPATAASPVEVKRASQAEVSANLIVATQQFELGWSHVYLITDQAAGVRCYAVIGESSQGGHAIDCVQAGVK